jgi:hypothetical protein
VDVYFISPKIIIHETLMHDKLMNHDECAAIIIDLGLIEAKTSLVRKEKHFDYA